MTRFRFSFRTVSTTLFAATMALGISAVRAEQPAAASPAHVEGLRLLDRTIEAHGGLERFRSYGTMRYHTKNLPYGAGRLTFDHVADLVARHHRMDGDSPRGAFIAAANATQGWTTNAEALGITPRWITHGNSYFVMMPFVFADPGITVTAVGQRTFAGQTFDAVSIRYGQGVGDTAEDDYVLYLDRQTHRLRLIDFAVTHKAIRGDTPIDQVPRFSLEFVEWQRADGLLVPSRLHFAVYSRTADGGGRANEGARYTVSGVRFARARPDAALFEPVDGATIE